MKQMRVMVILVIGLLIPSVLFAASPWTTGATYGDKVKGKLEFGFRNLFAGWTEIFTEPMEYKKDGKNVFAGIGMGLVNAPVDTLGGALHLVTAPLPQIDIPLPQNGAFSK